MLPRLTYLLPVLPAPQFHTIKKHKRTLEHVCTHPNWTHPGCSCAWGDKLGSLSAWREVEEPLVRGTHQHTPTHAHIESSTSIVGKFHSTPDNRHCPWCLRVENMVLPLWEVESFSSLKGWYRDRQINREKDRECISERKIETGGKDEPAFHLQLVWKI